MLLRALPLALLAFVACGDAPNDENVGPRGATVRVSPVEGDAPGATLAVQQTSTGVRFTVVEGELPVGDRLVVRIDEECPTGDAMRGDGLRDPAPGASEMLAPPAGEDEGATQAAMKGERADSSRVTADETGQAADRLRPTTATPERRRLELTRSGGGWEAPRITVEELLGRNLVVDGPSGPLCGRARVPSPAG